MARVEEQGIGQPVVLDVPLAPVPSVETGERLTTETTTRQTPQGTVETQVIEQRQVQQIPVDLSAVMPGFFQESDYSWSCMRLMCCIALLASILFGAMALLLPSAQGPGVTLAGLFLAASFTGKVAQKALEKPSTPG